MNLHQTNRLTTYNPPAWILTFKAIAFKSKGIKNIHSKKIKETFIKRLNVLSLNTLIIFMIQCFFHLTFAQTIPPEESFELPSIVAGTKLLKLS